VGPTAEGEFPEPCIERLQDMGTWLKANGESIYGTTAGPFPYLSWGAATRKGDLLYLHVTAWPENGKLNVPLSSKVTSAALLIDPEEPLPINRESERIVVNLPEKVPDPVATVLKLKLDGEPEAMPLASQGKAISASSEHPDHPVLHVMDGSGHEIWESADTTGESYLEIDMGDPTWIHATGFDEPDRWPRYKQYIRFEIEAGNGWDEIFSVQTHGHGLVKKFDPIEARRVRLYVERAEGPPAIAEWQLYAPE
jgi:alpha-L-fucosidase